jgi:hypothetical protein
LFGSFQITAHDHTEIMAAIKKRVSLFIFALSIISDKPKI